MAALSVNVATLSVLLSVFCLSGGLAYGQNSIGLFVTAPRQMEALSGSCLQIPCSFEPGPPAPGQDFDKQGPLSGVWIKNDSHFAKNPDNVIFNSRETDHRYPMDISGDLKQNNCTTLFSDLITSYTDTYYFRVEAGSFKATASTTSLQIRVKDSPPSPTVEIPGDLKEGQSVTITCSASTPCPHSPPELTWTLQQDSRSTTEENTDRTLATKIQQTITLSDTHDGSVITCSARYPVNEGNDVRTAETEVTLSVLYAPKDTSASISPSGWVSAGTWVNLTCSSRAKPPVSRFTWFKNSTDGPVKVSEGAFYSFNATDGGVYYCVAINDLGSLASPRVQPKIGESSQLLTALIAAGSAVLIALICLAVSVWWFKSKHPAPPRTQSETGEELALEMQTNKTEEDIHYGDISFCKRRPEPSSASVQDRGQPEETVYVQVKVSEPEDTLRQAAGGPEELYA